MWLKDHDTDDYICVLVAPHVVKEYQDQLDMLEKLNETDAEMISYFEKRSSEFAV